MLKVNDINVYYGKIHALKGISLDVKQGEIVALIGANGAGKSTTLKTISGMLRTKTGSISFLDEDISHTDAHKLVAKGLAHVPEGRRCFLRWALLQTPQTSRQELRTFLSVFPALNTVKTRLQEPFRVVSSRCLQWAELL